MDDDSNNNVGEFDFATAKQSAVLDLLGHNRTSKEIAHALQISEAAVNRRIEVLRARLGGVARAELIRRYRLWSSNRAVRGDSPCVDSEMQILPLAKLTLGDERPVQDSPGIDLAFKDSLEMKIDAPWTRPDEPQIVPRVLDGEKATLTRGMAIAIILLAIIASLVLGLAAAQAIAEAVS